ncbi:low molecular weight phosphotyrosine protein phosphatase [Catenovulum sp. 2E275]|uniref:low molecular weight protein-tyrosine-phosphatase n=1 Tax=Catenovulum sp. 2E275 TaxID=2980497 RepID=UPI0021D1FC4B|nr:low molecular weight protein-tyrosine-phosphatase [Catenovulum sp. 2E275]MCU4676499.1 low molecular weight phosphotyrosine protein phosphatase [Catenovulum sp. 2E275]
MTSSQKLKARSVLFVCLGNICRSPTAHAVFRQLAKDARLPIEIDSAGTAGYHKGAAPDKRAKAAGVKRGYDFSKLAARPVISEDFEKFDLILAMDKANYQDLISECPAEYQHKIQLFLNFAENYPAEDEVPDPYYGGAQGFEYVLDLVEDASNGLLKRLV